MCVSIVLFSYPRPRRPHRVPDPVSHTALLGEVDVLSGSVSCPRSSPGAIALPSIAWDAYLTDDNWVSPAHVAFVPQQAWLQNASVRDNVIFGLPFREERYRATLEACSLVSDLEILEDGDSTEIGEKVRPLLLLLSWRTSPTDFSILARRASTCRGASSLSSCLRRSRAGG